ncbi:MAG: UvrD-helicase domain-containing protein, partial [Lachnospiraceae bacterium]|nr:UvrD-helicase domain-containing protein [Lachnospiraceae bacterium]
MDKNEFLQKYASHLNDNQLKAVQTVDGPILLLAVPGSGKTTVLVTRLGYMLLCQGIDPRNILTLTYTIAATKDMKQRYEKIFGEGAGRDLEFRTINGICYKIIQNYAYLAGKSEDSIFRLITDEKETSRILADILSKLLDDYPTESDIKGIRM